MQHARLRDKSADCLSDEKGGWGEFPFPFASEEVDEVGKFRKRGEAFRGSVETAWLGNMGKGEGDVIWDRSQFEKTSFSAEFGCPHPGCPRTSPK